MAFTNRLNFKQEGYLINDEEIELTGGLKNYVLKHHNLLQGQPVSVWTGEGMSGSQISDFTVSNLSDKPWVYKVTFGASVTDGTYYINYTSQGDENDADDINYIYQNLDRLNKKSTNGDLVMKHTVVDNIEIYPTSIDSGVTGTNIVTTSQSLYSLGYNAGSKYGIITVPDKTLSYQLPYELNGIDNRGMEVIDDNSFYLLEGGASGTRMNFGSANPIEVNGFHFEDGLSNSTVLDMSILNLKHAKVILYGSRGRAGWSYVRPTITHDDGTWKEHLGFFGDGRDGMAFYYEFSFRLLENGYCYVSFDKALKYIPETSVFKESSTSIDGGDGYILRLSNPTLTEFSIDFGLANGSVIEVYDMGEGNGIE